MTKISKKYAIPNFGGLFVQIWARINFSQKMYSNICRYSNSNFMQKKKKKKKNRKN